MRKAEDALLLYSKMMREASYERSIISYFCVNSMAHNGAMSWNRLQVLQVQPVGGHVANTWSSKKLLWFFCEKEYLRLEKQEEMLTNSRARLRDWNFSSNVDAYRSRHACRYRSLRLVVCTKDALFVLICCATEFSSSIWNLYSAHREWIYIIIAEKTKTFSH